MNLDIQTGKIDTLAFSALTEETITYLRQALGLTTTPTVDPPPVDPPPVDPPPVDPPPPPPSGTFGAPTGLARTGNVISWATVSGAVKYKLRIRISEASE